LRLEGLERLASVREFSTPASLIRRIQRSRYASDNVRLPLRLAAFTCTEPLHFATSVCHRRPNVPYQRHQTRRLRPMYAAAARHRPILRTRRDCSPSAREPCLTRGRARRAKAAARWPAETSRGCRAEVLLEERAFACTRDHSETRRGRRSLQVFIARPSAGAE
jgi:hypothetical protein